MLALDVRPDRRAVGPVLPRHVLRAGKSALAAQAAAGEDRLRHPPPHRGRELCRGRRGGDRRHAGQRNRAGQLPGIVRSPAEEGARSRRGAGRVSTVVRNQRDLQLCRGHLQERRVRRLRGPGEHCGHRRREHDVHHRGLGRCRSRRPPLGAAPGGGGPGHRLRRPALRLWPRPDALADVGPGLGGGGILLDVASFPAAVAR